MKRASTRLEFPQACRLSQPSRSYAWPAQLTSCLAVATFLVFWGAQTVSAQQRDSAPQPVAERAADIEERLIDLQVQLATMRSLAANAAPVSTGVPAQQSTPVGAAPPDVNQQIASLETELMALSSEMQQLSGKPTAIRPSTTTARLPSPAGPDAGLPLAGSPPAGSGAATGWFGSTTVTPNPQGLAPNGGGAPIGPAGTGPATGTQGEILPQNVFPGNPAPIPFNPRGTTEGTTTPGSNSVAGWANPAPPSSAPPATFAPGAPGPAADVETEYQSAYGLLLQQDYGAAQSAFTDFVARHPDIPLAGNAQYWIGETHYVRGAYKDAAVAFLKGFEKYGNGNKGADSLLKLGMSLGRLNQTAAACSSLRELGNRYATAPEAVLSRGKDEMRRLKC